MPDITAWADAFRDWDGLIGQLNENGALVPGHDALKAELVAIYEQARVQKVQQESLKGNLIAATDRFLDSVEAGRKQARRVRSFIVSVLGPNSPHLPLFGIPTKPVPNRNNRRKSTRRARPAAPPQTPPNPAPEASTTTPAAEKAAGGAASAAKPEL